MAVGIYNMNYDEVINPVINLNNNFKHIEFFNCKGSLDGNKVILSEDIPPYSAVFFEVK